MKIILSSTRNEWYIETDQGWYSLDSQAEVEMAVSVLPLRVINDYKEVDQCSFEGSASIHGIANNAMQMELKDTVGKSVLLTEVSIDETCLCSIDWAERPFQDGWVRANSELSLDNVSKFELKVFAPVIEGHPDKIVHIQNKTSGTQWEFTLIRGQENTLTLLSHPQEGRQDFVLCCDAEPLEDSTDTRDLGFVLVDEVVAA